MRRCRPAEVTPRRRHLQGRGQQPVLDDIVFQLVEATNDPVELTESFQYLAVSENPTARHRQVVLALDVA